MKPTCTLYERHAFDYLSLPPAVRRFHSLRGNVRIPGSVAIGGAETRMGRLFCALLRFPRPAASTRFVFVLCADAQREVWTRRFPGRTLRTVIRSDGSLLVERSGVVRLFYRTHCAPSALTMTLEKLTLLGCAVPQRLRPIVRATEQDADGYFRFDVEVLASSGRRLIAYTGVLDLDAAESV
jgi:hypothetical protein